MDDSLDHNYIDPYSDESGTTPASCPTPTDGQDGVGISNIQQTDDTHFVITLTNAVQYTLTIPEAPGIKGDKGDTGTNGTNGTDGEKGDKGDTGTAGTNGTNGTNGTDGEDGVDGNNMRYGTGVPSAGLGSTGDGYLDYSTFNFYTKSGVTWTLQGNIEGATGPQGDIGINWQGNYPTNSPYNTNDGVQSAGSSYIATADGITNDPATDPTNWGLVAQKGAVGATGASGTNGTNGVDGTNGTNGTNGTDGRSIAVYEQTPDPSGTNTIYPGDIWIVV